MMKLCVCRQNAVRLIYPEAKATYRFRNRSSAMRFNQKAFDYIQQAIKSMDDMQLTPEEKGWLKMTCPYFPKDYLEYLSTFKLDSAKQVRLDWRRDPDSEFGELDIESAPSSTKWAGFRLNYIY